jgi:hypothetical protein
MAMARAALFKPFSAKYQRATMANFHDICDAFCHQPTTWPDSLFCLYITLEAMSPGDMPSDLVQDLARKLWIRRGDAFTLAQLKRQIAWTQRKQSLFDKHL